MDVRLAVRRAIGLHDDGQLPAAVEAYRAILTRHPEAGVCWSNLGMALRELGLKDEGLEALRKGVRVCPELPEINYNLGNALADRGDLEGALACYRAALARGPGYLKAACACGGLLLRLRRFEEAVDHYGAALRHADDAVLHAGLGWALWKLPPTAGATAPRRRVAATALRRAIALDPTSSECRWRLHVVLRWLGRYEENERQLRAGLARDASSPDLQAALAQTVIDQGRLDEGLACCRAALAVDPDHEDARLARGRANFLAGRYGGAWPERYRQVRGIDRRPEGTAGREWVGQDLAGQSILLYGEQGLGDVIQYARYAPLVAGRAGRVVLACRPRLVGLLRRLPHVDSVVPSDQPPPATDWHCSLLDVPAVRGDELDAIPGACPYLPPVHRELAVLPPARQFRVAIVWAGSPTQKRDGLRSCRLEDFAPLFEAPGAEFVSFQVGPRARELRAGWRGLVRDATLLGYAPDWRWMLGRRDTPWYPTMRLFRQPEPNDWDSVFREVRRELAALLAESGRAAKGSDVDPASVGAPPGRPS